LRALSPKKIFFVIYCGNDISRRVHPFRSKFLVKMHLRSNYYPQENRLSSVVG
jgi:hypothetical protein